MIAGDLTSAIVQKLNDSRTMFIYFAYHGQIIAEKKDAQISDCLDYTNLIFDQLSSNKVSHHWFSMLQNDIGENIDSGVMLSDAVHWVRNYRKEDIYQRIQFPKNKILISFFDHTVGWNGMLNFNAYKQLLKSALQILDLRDEYFIAYKSKKPYSFLENILESDTILLIEILKKHPRFVYVNDYGITSYEIAGASDLVVSSPLSSINYEAVSGGIKTIVYDPLNEYNESHIHSNKIPYFNAHNHEQLEILVNYWLYECNDDQFCNFQDKYIKPDIDKHCDGRNTERFRKLILS